METKFNKQETIKLIEEYYEKLEGRKVSVTITSKVGCIGLYETKGCITNVVVNESMEIAGMNKSVSYNLSSDDVSKSITAVLDLYGLTATSVSLDDGISSRCEGYGMAEHMVDKAYCNGVVVRLEKKKNVVYKK